MVSTIKNKNFSLQLIDGFYELPPQAGDIFERCNFTQAHPHTKMSDAYTGLTFVSCNMRNVDPPADAILIDCPNSHWSRCSHLHESWTQLDQCADDCIHVVDSDTVEIDGQPVATIYYYADTRE